MITIAEHRDVVPFPAPAQTLAESGLSLDLVLQLTLKSLHFAGELTGTDLSRRLGLEFPVIAPALEFLKGQQLIAIVGGGFVGGASYRYGITDAGRTRSGAVPRDQPLRRRRAGTARAVPDLSECLPRGGPAGRHARARSSSVLPSRHQRQGPRPARPGDQCRPLDVRLRSSRKWQDRHLAGHPHAARRRHRHPARDRGRRPHHPVVRSRQS